MAVTGSVIELMGTLGAIVSLVSLVRARPALRRGRRQLAHLPRAERARLLRTVSAAGPVGADQLSSARVMAHQVWTQRYLLLSFTSTMVMVCGLLAIVVSDGTGDRGTEAVLAVAGGAQVVALVLMARRLRGARRFLDAHPS